MQGWALPTSAYDCNTSINIGARDLWGSRRFEYNPCSPFYCHLELSSAVCVANWLPEDQNLGNQSSAVFKETYDPFSITISYSNPPFHADVTYECRHNVQGNFYIDDVSDAQYFKFRVQTNAIVATIETRIYIYSVLSGVRVQLALIIILY